MDQCTSFRSCKGSTSSVRLCFGSKQVEKKLQHSKTCLSLRTTFFLPRRILQIIFPQAGKIVSRSRGKKKILENETCFEEFAKKVTLVVERITGNWESKSKSELTVTDGGSVGDGGPTSTSLFFQQMKKECEDFVLDG